MVWRVTNQNAAGQRIHHGFFDARFARECHLNSACQPLIPFEAIYVPTLAPAYARARFQGKSLAFNGWLDRWTDCENLRHKK
jgi:hypothetical protein